ncbi:MAG: exo-alpha-sialidase [Candidatus Dormibacteraeota bacterium]|nr:exo-alpha-sialidase [Candidatus Dormibacteraeota bacterium]
MSSARRLRRVALAAAAVAGGALMSIGGAAAAGPFEQAPFSAQGLSIMQTTASTRMTIDDKLPARGYGGPSSMLVDPANPRVIVAQTTQLRTRTCKLLRSDDAGATWHILPGTPSPSAYPYCMTPGDAGSPQAVIAWGKNNVLYYAMAGYNVAERQSQANWSIVLAKSTDLGASWTSTVVENNRPATGDSAPSDYGVTGLAVDTSGAQDVVYVGWMKEFPASASTSPLQDGEVDVATSTDGGLSFGKPANLNTFTHVTVTKDGTAYPLIGMSYFANPFLTAHDGTVLAVEGAQFSTTNAPGGNAFDDSIPLPQLVARSTDRGQTWTVNAMGPPTYTANGGGSGSMTGLGWTPKGGSQGTFVAAYAVNGTTSTTSGNQQIAVQRSSDGGQSWSDPVIIEDDDLSQSFTGFYPQMGVAPNGRVDVVWEDNRNTTNDHFQVFYTYSTDGGVTWAHNVQVTDQAINFDFGISYRGDIRQPPGVASTNDFAAVGWADPRLATADTGTQDDYGAIVQFNTIPPTTSPTWPIIVAVIDGFATAAIVAGLVILVRRRQRAGTVAERGSVRSG